MGTRVVEWCDCGKHPNDSRAFGEGVLMAWCEYCHGVYPAPKPPTRDWCGGVPPEVKIRYNAIKLSGGKLVRVTACGVDEQEWIGFLNAKDGQFVSVVDPRAYHVEEL